MERCVYHIFVSGIVQGVCFRYSINNFVNKNLKESRGFVKNLDDGRVEILIYATAAELNSLEEFSRTEIRSASVSNFDCSKAAVDETHLDKVFCIAR